MILDPSNLSVLPTMEVLDLAVLPLHEDDRFEFKSSLTLDADLGTKLERAAAAFWNAGGGFFVVGVDAAGDPDGGISPVVGRQPRRDWVDQAVHRVTPVGPYVSTYVQGAPVRGRISSGSGVLIVGFADSSVLPHMASDGRYYIRAGAHSVPASHFLVEALRARRGISAPQISFFLRPRPDTSGYAELEVVNISSVAAVDITVSIRPIPPLLQRRNNEGVVKVRLLDAAHPAFLPFTFVQHGPNDWVDVDQDYTVILEYSDTLKRGYRQEATFLPRESLPKPLGDRPPLETIATSLQRIDSRLSLLQTTIANSVRKQ
jgi:hypothetical protein